MSKIRIKDLVNQILYDFLKENNLELYNTEFLKEGKTWYLRVYIDKIQRSEDEELYVDTEDCEKVSRYLSEKLDEKDPIQENYILEVSSPGIDRQLFEPKDFKRFKGNMVDLKLYSNYEGEKNIQGKLVDLVDDKIILDINGKLVEFPRKQVAKTNLSVIL